MQAEVLGEEVPAVNPKEDWLKHCLSSARKFLKNAVVIDNEPFVESVRKIPIDEFRIVAPDDGMNDIAILEESIPIQQVAEEHEDSIDLHRLDVRKVSDAFAEEGLNCAFVLPDDNNFDEEIVVRRVLNAALISDIVVIDWYLYGDSPNLTRRILREIASSDVAENGRLRFICIYTGQPVVDQIYMDVRESLSEGGIYVEMVDEGVFFSKEQSYLVTVLNKAAILPSDLPSNLVYYFSRFADGLMPSFALAAVGAIRKNIHHMVTRFDKVLDSAYVANRLITNPPEDVAELMRELLVSECDNAVGLESVADQYLDKEAVGKWLSIKKDEIVSQVYGKKQVDSALLSLLLRNGIDDKGARTDAGDLISLPGEHRNKVSISLAGDEEKSKEAELSFSRLVVFKREAFGDTKLIGTEGWLPSLTTGTLLRMQDGESKRYFICLTPACDTLRLLKETPFVFLEAVVDDNRYSLILKEEEGNSRGLYFREKHPTLMTYSFLPTGNSERVRGEQHKPEGGKNFFTFTTTSNQHRFTWLGEVRYARAASEMAKLAGNWMRIGISDSEYLRLIECGKF